MNATETMLTVDVKCGKTWTPIPLDQVNTAAMDDILGHQRSGATSGYVAGGGRTYRWQAR